MLKKRIIALVTGIALMIAVVSTAANVADSITASVAPAGQAIACSPTSGSGGGC
jgi:hypothetical protein